MVRDLQAAEVAIGYRLMSRGVKVCSPLVTPNADYALPVNGDFVAAERHRFAGSVSLGMLGSPGCDLGTVTVLVTRPTGRVERHLDNAVIESWRSTLEFELRRVRHFATGAQARARVAAWIEEYNTARRHLRHGARWPGSWPAAGRRPREHEPAAARARPGR